MGAIIDGQQPGGVDVGIALGRRQRGMAQEFLDRAQIAAAGEEVGGEAVPQRMRCRPGGQAQQQA